MKRCLAVILIIGFLSSTGFIVTSCSDQYKIPPLPAEQIMEEFTSKVNAKIYIDASYSMVGFVNPGANTRYGRTIEVLEGALISGWETTHVDFWGFGDQIVPLEGRRYLDARKSSFYHIEKISSITNIQRVINKVTTSDLTLILTDLFQQGADVNLLIQQLKEKCFVQNLSFGIIGLRSEFDGYLYDLGLNQPAVYHRSKDQEPATFQPFYILFIGKYMDIVRFYERLKLAGLEFTLKEAVIYSPFLTNDPVTFNKATIDSTSSLTEVPNLIAPDQNDKRIKQFRIQGNPPVAFFVAKFPYSPAHYTMPFNETMIEIEVSATECFPDTFISKPEAIDALKISSFEILNDTLAVGIEISPSTLPGDGVYFYEIVIRPKAESYQLPKWFSEWDMERAASAASGSATGSFTGGSTLNLYRLLANLWNTNVVIHRPYIAVLYCCFKK